MFASISHDTHGWGMVQNLQSLPRTHKYPLIFPFYVHIHTCMHTYKNGYSPQMLFHLPECACLLAGPGHGQLQRDGFLTLLFKVYAIQRWVKATKNGSFATTCWFRTSDLLVWTVTWSPSMTVSRRTIKIFYRPDKLVSQKDNKPTQVISLQQPVEIPRSWCIWPAASLQETPNLSINWEALAAQAPVPAGTGPDKGADGKIFLNSRHDKFSDPNGEPWSSWSNMIIMEGMRHFWTIPFRWLRKHGLSRWLGCWWVLTPIDGGPQRDTGCNPRSCRTRFQARNQLRVKKHLEAHSTALSKDEFCSTCTSVLYCFLMKD